jgi:small acid-soluble spore protein D (minor alpha/beta-type SASP)
MFFIHINGVEESKIHSICCEVNEMSSSNKLLVPGVQQMLDQYKYEIAAEFGVTLGSDTVSRANGSVGGEITKQLVKHAQAQMNGKTK